MALSDTYPEAAQPIDSHVGAEQDLLGESTTGLLAHLESLRSRLSSILVDLPTEAALTPPSEVPPYRVMAAANIRDQRLCIERAAGIVMDILDRLRL